MDDDRVWQRRLLALTALRLAGVTMIGLGAAIAVTDWVRPGGDRTVGALLIVVGTLDSALAPFLLKRLWKPPS
ncbi:hypothetical protein ABDK56_07995 [Sphingomonas sp. ASV193]|uniref:hypothetical protein n=1 Tax=Sphingomonas sp. ASV193 TaxID=3144405 RepID=UPI0032E8E42C